MMNIHQRIAQSKKIAAAHAKRKALRQPPAAAPRGIKAGMALATSLASAGRRGAATRLEAYPESFELKFCRKDLTVGATAIDRAAKRSLFYLGRTPSEILTIGSMVAVGRKTSPRGKETEWFEYVADDAPVFRTYARLAKLGKTSTARSFTMQLLQSYTRR